MNTKTSAAVMMKRWIEVEVAGDLKDEDLEEHMKLLKGVEDLQINVDGLLSLAAETASLAAA